MRRTISQVLLYSSMLFCAALPITMPREASTQPGEYEALTSDSILIFKLKSEHQKGQGYKLIYTVDAPLEVFWKFKTDFDNDFLESNRQVKSHRFIGRQGNSVITHNEYTDRPGKIFKWQTTVDPDRHRLDFLLLEPSESGQKYHYGYIQLEALGPKTRVIQVAFFDFLGAALWVNYPFFGGMQYYLKNTTRWEQEAIIKLKDRY
jgi:hypothetical protein